ncbi:hypothetical protein HaLaN_25771, partial [Haematococcus lacustris]
MGNVLRVKVLSRYTHKVLDRISKVLDRISSKRSTRRAVPDGLITVFCAGLLPTYYIITQSPGTGWERISS